MLMFFYLRILILVLCLLLAPIGVVSLVFAGSQGLIGGFFQQFRTLWFYKGLIVWGLAPIIFFLSYLPVYIFSTGTISGVLENVSNAASLQAYYTPYIVIVAVHLAWVFLFFYIIFKLAYSDPIAFAKNLSVKASTGYRNLRTRQGERNALRTQGSNNRSSNQSVVGTVLGATPPGRIIGAIPGLRKLWTRRILNKRGKNTSGKPIATSGDAIADDATPVQDKYKIGRFKDSKEKRLNNQP